MERQRRERDGAAPAAREPPAPAPLDAVLQLQRGAGNAAVSRLMRDAAPAGTFNPIAPAPGGLASPGFTAAMNAVRTWFAPACQGRHGVAFDESLAELVALARALPVDIGGATKLVREEIPDPVTIEELLKQTAKDNHLTLRTNREVLDAKGAEAQTLAHLSNLGEHIPEVEFKAGHEKITVNLKGEVGVGVHAGRSEVEGKIGPEGGGAAVKTPGGKVEVSGTPKEIEAEAHIGDLVQVKGKVERKDDGAIEWKAALAFGTLGKIISAGEIAEVITGTQQSLAGCGNAMAAGAKHDPHEKPLNEKLHEAADRMKKSAAQNRPGWSFGGEASGDTHGGFKVQATFTVRF